jgi:hypothetical protein
MLATRPSSIMESAIALCDGNHLSNPHQLGNMIRVLMGEVLEFVGFFARF